jgi:membrane protein implicated in regulation of membrane protease activity
MSDEMQIADERKDMYQMILFLATASSIDAVMFCIFGALATAEGLGRIQLGYFRVWAALVAFTGVTLVGLYYIHKHALNQYTADGELA